VETKGPGRSPLAVGKGSRSQGGEAGGEKGFIRGKTEEGGKVCKSEEAMRLTKTRKKREDVKSQGQGVDGLERCDRGYQMPIGGYEK